MEIEDQIIPYNQSYQSYHITNIFTSQNLTIFCLLLSQDVSSPVVYHLPQVVSSCLKIQMPKSLNRLEFVIRINKMLEVKFRKSKSNKFKGLQQTIKLKRSHHPHTHNSKFNCKALKKLNSELSTNIIHWIQTMR